MTDTDTIFHKASFDIKRTKEASKAMEVRITGDVTSTLIQDAAKYNSKILDQVGVHELAKVIAGFLEGDGKFSKRVQQNLYDSLQFDMVERIDRAVEHRVDQINAMMSRTEIVNMLMENESFLNGNFIRGMMDNSRFRTMIENMVSKHVSAVFTDRHNWLIEQIEQAVESKTTLMVNETVERSLKMIASRISAGSDV